MERLTGQVALVTGASRGIGRAIAERLAHDGAAVAVGYHANRAPAEALATELRARGGQAVALPVDVTRHEDVRRFFDDAEARLGPATIAVANAGTLFVRPFVEMTAEDFETGFAVNTRGTFHVFLEASRRLREGGRIIGVSTNLTRLAQPGFSLYQASKAAVEQFVMVLAKELGPRHITVNAVSPGATETDMIAPAHHEALAREIPLGRLARPEDIANVVGFLASREAGWVNGQMVGANGGIV
ncbi:3-ketoacyl-ACP reductase [Corallococcus sp. H22C18031201]|uniref:SDR family oxidoreductase n=1 Tax=Citreicoccus inhibens TaxID=2849499 RepID=UPI000E72143A|nr:SDR family oxidoreductase [Citreicoccus inhibens]MBU8895941.1 SDR family oxidoreductase [Citreicoccus inhibens]RJS25823.1 3-ketoacyl-ACP reductase [Corallococcus sp. H22C18031201]